MRERLIELIKIYNPYFQNEKFADFLLENGVVVPPCKVGDIVYVIRRKSKRNRGGYYTSICSTKRLIQMAVKYDEAYIDSKRAVKTDIALIGITVFLTKEEAEQAIECDFKKQMKQYE